MDDERLNAGLPSLTEIDTKIFKSSIHMKGEHASTLIYACSLIDYYSIDQSKYEIVAILGNSMGWYSTLSFSESLHYKKAYSLIDIMGSMMKKKIIGGQIIYSLTDDNWNLNRDLIRHCINETKKVGAHISIYLGGYIVIGGDQKILNSLLKRLPKKENYPFQLPYHAAFHTPLLKSISKKAKEIFETQSEGWDENDAEELQRGLQNIYDRPEDFKESIKVINGKKYKPVKEEKKATAKLRESLRKIIIEELRR